MLKLTFKLDPNENYLPAQNVAIYPRNSMSKVQRALKLVKADPLAMFEPVSKQDLKYPKGITVKTLFTHFLDLNGVIKASTLKKLAANDITLSQSQNFQNLLKNKNIRNEYIKVKKNVLDLIEEFKIDLDVHKFVSVCSSIKVIYTKIILIIKINK